MPKVTPLVSILNRWRSYVGQLPSVIEATTVCRTLVLRSLKITLLVLQAFWMLVILPGHVRGMIVVGERCAPTSNASKASCCGADDKPYKPGDVPSQQRKDRCAVCYQAHGYSLPPVYAFDLTPSGLCELRRLIEPSKRHLLLCRPTYFANGPPDGLV